MHSAELEGPALFLKDTFIMTIRDELVNSLPYGVQELKGQSLVQDLGKNFSVRS